ncbi:hypothetical protein SAMN04487964_11221 [Marinobacterium sediminicola]|uniref:Uncharacterized protein n=1 Tax=Marinobacterium sediminicola TaxID=518898 RepID=A0ABY1S2J4_9GAMM|nr:hypothetical protein SAMN04487964_11221 [Marinobacterium sediminicola]
MENRNHFDLTAKALKGVAVRSGINIRSLDANLKSSFHTISAFKLSTSL